LLWVQQYKRERTWALLDWSQDQNSRSRYKSPARERREIVILKISREKNQTKKKLEEEKGRGACCWGGAMNVLGKNLKEEGGSGGGGLWVQG